MLLQVFPVNGWMEEVVGGGLQFVRYRRDDARVPQPAHHQPRRKPGLHLQAGEGDGRAAGPGRRARPRPPPARLPQPARRALRGARHRHGARGGTVRGHQGAPQGRAPPPPARAQGGGAAEEPLPHLRSRPQRGLLLPRPPRLPPLSREGSVRPSSPRLALHGRPGHTGRLPRREEQAAAAGGGGDAGGGRRGHFAVSGERDWARGRGAAGADASRPGRALPDHPGPRLPPARPPRLLRVAQPPHRLRPPPHPRDFRQQNREQGGAVRPVQTSEELLLSGTAGPAGDHGGERARVPAADAADPGAVRAGARLPEAAAGWPPGPLPLPLPPAPHPHPRPHALLRPQPLHPPGGLRAQVALRRAQAPPRTQEAAQGGTGAQDRQAQAALHQPATQQGQQQLPPRQPLTPLIFFPFPPSSCRLPAPCRLPCRWAWVQAVQSIQMKYSKPDAEMGSEHAESRKINWQEYNYPMCLKIFHYSPEETPEGLRRRVALLRVNHVLILVALLWNFINNCVDAGEGVSQGGIRIAISIFVFLGWLPASFYLFIIPYEAYMGREGKLFVFYLLSLLAVVWFFLWSIADFADANGWIMVASNSNNQRGAATFFSVITSILMLAISILAVVNVVLFWKRPASSDQ